jgi:hypothetical protein
MANVCTGATSRVLGGILTVIFGCIVLLFYLSLPKIFIFKTKLNINVRHDQLQQPDSLAFIQLFPLGRTFSSLPLKRIALCWITNKE